MKSAKFRISIATLLLVLVSTPVVFAQNQGGGSGTSGNGDQTRDRDQVQDPTTHDGDEPIQDRNQDRLKDGSGDNCINDSDCDGVPDQDRVQDRTQLRDSSLQIGDEPIKDQTQLRDRLRDQLINPDQDRDRDRIRANDAAGLQEVISTSELVGNDFTNELEADIRELARNRNRLEVGVMALIASQNMIGQEGEQIAGLAQEIHSAHRIMTGEEEQIQARSFFRRFFFGGNTTAASAIQNQLQQNEQRMIQITQRLNDCDCDEQVRAMLQEQVRLMEEEQARLRQLAEDEMSRWGLFSWRL